MGGYVIIECPNCFLEQPLDQYCAGCGKQLDKLIDEKKKNRQARIKKTNYVIALISISFLMGSYFYYSSLQKQNVPNEEQDLIALYSPKKIELPKAKIKGKVPAVAKAQPKPRKVKKKVPKKVSAAALVTEEPSALDGQKKIDTFYFVSLENCDSKFPEGELSKDQRTEILNCAKVHLKTKSSKEEEILEDGVSFATDVRIEMQEFLITLSFSLTTDLYEEDYKQTLPLDLDDSSVATLWSNIGHDIESNEPPDEEMLSSYATSVLFNFTSPSKSHPKLYFLATYK